MKEYVFLYKQINSSSLLLHTIPNKSNLPQAPLINCLFLNTEQNKISTNVLVVRKQYLGFKRTLMQLCIYAYKSFRIWKKKNGMGYAVDRREISRRREWVTVF